MNVTYLFRMYAAWGRGLRRAESLRNPDITWARLRDRPLVVRFTRPVIRTV